MIAFFYGRYQTIIDSFRPNGIICSNCESPSQIVVEKRINVFHIMYIPFFPSRPRNTFTCKSCSHNFDLRELDTESKEYFEQFKSKKRVPVWLFSGPLLILVVICWSGYDQINQENEMLQRLMNGSQTQIIEYETDKGQYSSLKTLKITSDSVWLNYNEFEIESYQYIDRITDLKNYSSDTTKISIQSMKEIFEDGKVKAIYPSR